MMRSYYSAVAGLTLFVGLSSVAEAGGLRGSPTSMREQHSVAVDGDLTFIDDAAEVRKLVQAGGLEMITGNDDYLMNGVSYPYAVPQVRLFIERLATQYQAANSAQLVVTSLTRPSSQQPNNAHELSVHPAGMAVDFRIPQDAKSRSWLEKALLELENAGVLDVTRERFPPHYHVAVFPDAYAAYLKRVRVAETAVTVAQTPPSATSAAPGSATVATATRAAGSPNAGLLHPAPMLVALTGILLTTMLSTFRFSRARKT